MQKLVRILGTAAVVAAALGGTTACNDDSSTSASATSSTTTAAHTTTAAAPAPTSHGRPCTAEDIKTTGGFGEAPTITIPTDCDPPTTLITKDLVTGAGPAAKAGDKLQMNYTLVTWSDGKKLDSSFDRGEPFALTLGGGQVIKGWDQGLEGIQQGTRRLLIIPPQLGYGAGGHGIKPNETLVFVTDAVKVG
ncbi:FKBP-type peptidyl-prolyl cis-trans isomerase [Nocardia stercoris]|uniref:Peptidyl-prolyl cis-trans isomerase n=1 Tax=Nocardia stercoris TaxID=2483361 RepID=A0A3M2L646_9NOCA|nr:FKBP-type peptidyl-prolyl cis-trans isomerase [Nocardia stercoris]RMI32814.1 FKBP-type peptidyl-prolyl cis-trans isomerase [Nocardia stercoris]